MRLKAKQVLTVMTACAAATGLLSGCSTSKTGTAETTQAAQTAASGTEAAGTQAPAATEEAGDPINLTFWRAGTDVETEEYWKQFIGRFEEKYPDITVELSNMPWGDEVETKLNAAFASGTAPDVINYSIVSIPQRASTGQYMPLDDMIAGWDGKDDIMPSVLKTGMYGGKVYGLGMRPDARMFVWRRDMFKAAGLDPDTPPKNWEELKEYADKLTIKENGTTVQGGYTLSVANGFQDFQIFLTQNGGDFINTDTLDVLYDSDKAVEALTFLNDIVQSGDVIPSDQFQSGSDAFINGLSAMAYKNPSDIRGMLNSHPELKDQIGMSGPLTKEKQSTFCGMGLQFINAETKHKDAAWKFVEMSMSPDEVWARQEQLGIPVVLKSQEEKYVALDPKMNQAVLDSIASGQGAYAVTFSNRLNEVVSAAIEQAYFGKKTPEQALKDSAEEFRAEIPTLTQ